ncbi:mucin-binding protein, partial [Lacticaseibacillus sp. GG6-2]
MDIEKGGIVLVGDYRKLSTHNRLRQEPEVKTRVKLFKSKGRWLTALLVAVGTVMTVQGQTTHAATTATDATPTQATVKPNDSSAMATTSQTVKLDVAPTMTKPILKEQSVQNSQTTQTTATTTKTDDANTGASDTEQDTPKVATEPKVNQGPTEDVQPAQVETKSNATSVDTSKAPKYGVSSAQGTTNSAEPTTTGQKRDTTSDVTMTSDTKQQNAQAVTPNQTTEDVVTTSATAASTTSSADVPATSELNEDQPRFKTAVDPVSSSLVDSIQWTPIADPETFSISREVTQGGKQYTFTVAVPPTLPDVNNGFYGVDNPLFNNFVSDTANPQPGVGYQYSWFAGRTSDYYMRDLTVKNADGSDDYQALAKTKGLPVTFSQGVGSDGTQYLQQSIVDTDHKLTIKEIISVDSTGAFDHTIVIVNDASSALTNVKFGTKLDTALGMNDGTKSVDTPPALADDVPIISNGDGSAYITTLSDENPNGLTLYLTPEGDATLNVGQWFKVSDLKNAEQVAGTSNGQVLANVRWEKSKELDSAAEYETPVIASLAPGASVSYSYKENLYSVPVTKGTVTLKYVDENNQAIPNQPDRILGGVVGSPFSLTLPEKTIDGYTYDRSEGNVTQFTKDSQILTLVFKKKEVKQTATVTYVDETGKQLVTPDQSITGLNDTEVDHSQLMPNIQKAIDQGYVLVDDGTVGATFDHDTPHNQEFTITFGQVPKATLTTTVVPKGPKSPKNPDGEPLTPTTPVQVTGFPGDPIDAKDYPKVPGYTPEPNQNLKVPNEPGDTIVTYTPDTQKAAVKYVDQTGTQLITPDQVITGPSDTAVDHSQLMPNIQKAIDQGYVLVDDGTVGATFDHDTLHNQEFTITFGQVPKATLTTTVVPKGPKSPKDPDGEPLPPTTPVQVTGFPGDPIDAKDYPKVPGYTPEPNQNLKVPNEP